jgi:hypothetical protein
MGAIIQRELAEVECFKCGVVFWVAGTLHRFWKRDKTPFYCPNGHEQAYVESTAEKLQKRVDAQTSLLNSALAQRRKLEIEIARLKKKMSKPNKR